MIGDVDLRAMVGKTSYDCVLLKSIDQPKEVEAFLVEILEVCKRHGFSISHEDGHGGFKIEEWDESNAEWLGSALYNVGQV